MHFVPKKDGTGNRPTTIADARKLGLLPGVTQVLQVLDKPALREWLIRQAVYAVVTSPDVDGEVLDAKITRVLEQERQQDEESQIARDRGTEIHAALEDLFCGKPISPEIDPWVRPAFDAVCKYGELVATERVLVGDGYAGKTDLIQLAKDCWWLWDYKSAKSLPTKGAYPENRLQLSAYAKAWESFSFKQSQDPMRLTIRTGNIYISTADCGKFVICEHVEWQETYKAFASLVAVWQWQNGYQC